MILSNFYFKKYFSALAYLKLLFCMNASHQCLGIVLVFSILNQTLYY